MCSGLSFRIVTITMTIIISNNNDSNMTYKQFEKFTFAILTNLLYFTYYIGKKFTLSPFLICSTNILGPLSISLCRQYQWGYCSHRQCSHSVLQQSSMRSIQTLGKWEITSSTFISKFCWVFTFVWRNRRKFVKLRSYSTYRIFWC